jgi:hypothetical protein
VASIPGSITFAHRWTPIGTDADRIAAARLASERLHDRFRELIGWPAPEIELWFDSVGGVTMFDPTRAPKRTNAATRGHRSAGSMLQGAGGPSFLELDRLRPRAWRPPFEVIVT